MDTYLPSAGGTVTGDLTIHGSLNVNGNSVLDKGKYFAFIGSIPANTTKTATVKDGTQGVIITVGQGGTNGITIFRTTSSGVISFTTTTDSAQLNITTTPKASSSEPAYFSIQNKNTGNTCYVYAIVLNSNGSIDNLE